MGKRSPALVETFARLDALYARLPPLECKGGCAIACGDLPLTDAEARRLQTATHIKPRTVIKLLAEGGGPPLERQRCIYLTPEDRCSVYAIRPLICRAWGVLKGLSCMRGCVPARWYSDLEFLELALAVERIGGGRILHTTTTGLVDYGECWSDLVRRSGDFRDPAHIEADAERTRGLRAILGGRVIAAVTGRPHE